ncbi:hypothetical protein BJ508DRAFT_348698 [Ascobolus immersus RN42]|uniref:Uncharacterized protein n=1 Tax=Ascobolus immersus RN42 TaxID=1160509 RepID=A0A3N4ING9_ASCIM|nr:hypothetical protein BJ508DRAFT_348698 [Ascobolus immersus RN42]
MPTVLFLDLSPQSHNSLLTTMAKKTNTSKCAGTKRSVKYTEPTSSNRIKTTKSSQKPKISSKQEAELDSIDEAKARTATIHRVALWIILLILIVFFNGKFAIGHPTSAVVKTFGSLDVSSVGHLPDWAILPTLQVDSEQNVNEEPFDTDYPVVAKLISEDELLIDILTDADDLDIKIPTADARKVRVRMGEQKLETNVCGSEDIVRIIKRKGFLGADAGCGMKFKIFDFEELDVGPGIEEEERELRE